MTTIVCCSIIVVMFLTYLVYIISIIKEKNIASVASSTIYKTQKGDEFEDEFIDFLKNNINEKNRYKIKNNIYE